jgi:hypothetical protein
VGPRLVVTDATARSTVRESGGATIDVAALYSRPAGSVTPCANGRTPGLSAQAAELPAGEQLIDAAHGAPVHIFHQQVSELAVSTNAHQSFDAGRSLEALPISFILTQVERVGDRRPEHAAAEQPLTDFPV